MKITENHTARVAALSAIILSLVAGGASATINDNGDFSNGLTGWQNTSSDFGGNWAGSASNEISDDAPYVDVFKMTATSGSNYRYRFLNETALSQTYSAFTISFDWKVPTKETPWGGTFITIDLLDASGIIGRIAAIDTSDSVHTLDYWRGSIPQDSFYGIRKYRETFDWEAFFVDTATLLPGLDETQVERINIDLFIQNNAGSGGVLYVDNFAVTGQQVFVEPSYESSCQPSSQSSDQPTDVINLSTNAYVWTGTNSMTAGFVVQGEVAKAFYIHVLGPTLQDFGVSGILNDPKITLYSIGDQTIEIDANDDWQQHPTADVVAAAFATLGGRLRESEPALSIMLPEGSYTIVVEGADGGTGVASVNITELEAVFIPAEGAVQSGTWRNATGSVCLNVSSDGAMLSAEGSLCDGGGSLAIDLSGKEPDGSACNIAFNTSDDTFLTNNAFSISTETNTVNGTFTSSSIVLGTATEEGASATCSAVWTAAPLHTIGYNETPAALPHHDFNSSVVWEIENITLSDLSGSISYTFTAVFESDGAISILSSSYPYGAHDGIINNSSTWTFDDKGDLETTLIPFGIVISHSTFRLVEITGSCYVVEHSWDLGNSTMEYKMCKLP